MSDHDPLCPFSDTFGAPCMYCALITRVRADQDNRECDHCTDLARLKIADLRAKVEALPSAYIVAGVWVNARPSDDDEWGDKPAVLRDAVLALFDGSSE